MGKTIAIIPARGNSKRLKGKNILNFNGLPLIVHSINYALKNSSIIDAVYVSTDDNAIKEVALNNGAKIIDRPDELSGDNEPTVTALKHALEVINDEVDTVILLQATNPLRPKNLLAEAIEVFKEMNLESLFTVSRNYEKLGKIENNKFTPFNYKIGQRSQDLEPLYYENGLLYITRTSLIKNDIIFNDTSHPYVVNHKYAEVDIDTYNDLKHAEFVLNHFNEE